MIKLFCLISFILLSFNVSANKKDKVVMTIGGIPVTQEEFTFNYRKNNTNILEASDKKTPSEYLDLYIKFKLKVLEAQRLGYDTVRSFLDELKGYRKELARPYLTDVSFNEEMIQTAYFRTRHERKASHLLILVSPEASPADTLKAWNKISELREQIIKGADFNEIASKHSEDPSAKDNNGQLGYFSAFQMVYPFEDMTYKTAIGQVSNIIRTRFGYHIIKVEDERPTRGEIKVAHIMKMFPQQASEETIAALKTKIDSIYEKVISGDDFAELANAYSDDKQSAAQGGVMNWFSATNMVPSFAEAAFALQKDGDVSPVIRTPYGWHIIKRIELKAPLLLEKMRSELEAKIIQNPAISKYSDDAFDKKLRTEYQLKINESNVEKLAGLLIDRTTKQNWADSANTLKDAELFQFASQFFTVSDFIAFLQNQDFAATDTYADHALKTMLHKFINRELISYEDTQLEKKHSDFAHTIKEYHDGILLFNISKDKIWDVASNDTVRLEEFYNTTPKKYYFGERFKGWIVRSKDNDTRLKVETIIDQKELVSKQEIADVFNTSHKDNVEIMEVAVEKGEDPVVDYFIWSGAKPLGLDETTTFVHGKVSNGEQKTLKEAWGLYSSDFQEHVEKEWIDSLKKKYPVKINKKVLKTIQSVE